MSIKYLPIDEIIEKNEKIQKLEDQGLIITPNNLDNYLKQFKGIKSKKPSKEFWQGKRVLITGIAGFVGSHLTERLLELGVKVYGCELKGYSDYNIKHIKEKISIQEVDLKDINSTVSIVKNIEPHYIFHLAASSSVSNSFAEPSRALYNNLTSTINLFESARAHHSDLEGLQVACSSEQYGLVNIDELPISEDLKINPFRPRSIYGITKITTEHIAILYNNAYGVPSYITRAFNHEGPRRGLQYVTSVIHRQILRIMENKQKNLIIGNPNAIRDFTHVFDTIRAYLLVCEKGKRSEPYNICSGRGINIANYIAICKNLYNLNAPVLIDPNKMRPSEVPIIIGDNQKITKETGWIPIYPITKIIEDGINYLKEHSDLVID